MGPEAIIFLSAESNCSFETFRLPRLALAFLSAIAGDTIMTGAAMGLA